MQGHGNVSFMKGLVNQFLVNKTPTNPDIRDRAYEEALKFAKELGGSHKQAASFATWFSTLTGWSEPHPPFHPVKINGLNREFARHAWGIPHVEKLHLPDDEAGKKVKKMTIESFTQYVPRIDSIKIVEGDYESAFRRVWELICKLLPD